MHATMSVDAIGRILPQCRWTRTLDAELTYAHQRETIETSRTHGLVATNKHQSRMIPEGAARCGPERGAG